MTKLVSRMVTEALANRDKNQRRMVAEDSPEVEEMRRNFDR